MAAGLVEMRRDLLWSVENGRRVTQVLKAITHRPDEAFDAPGAYLIVRTAIRRLDAAVRAARSYDHSTEDVYAPGTDADDAVPPGQWTHTWRR